MKDKFECTFDVKSNDNSTHTPSDNASVPIDISQLSLEDLKRLFPFDLDDEDAPVLVNTF